MLRVVAVEMPGDFDVGMLTAFLVLVVMLMVMLMVFFMVMVFFMIMIVLMGSVMVMIVVVILVIMSVFCFMLMIVLAFQHDTLSTSTSSNSQPAALLSVHSEASFKSLNTLVHNLVLSVGARGMLETKQIIGRRIQFDDHFMMVRGD